MAKDYIEVDLTNKRKTWIRFTRYELSDAIGELSFHFNRTKSDYQFKLLDELITHLENHDQRA